MENINKRIKNAIKRKFINPIKVGCDYNILRLPNCKKIKHKETVGLLKQAYNTLKNVEYNLKQKNLVDANSLLRCSFEYIMMAMMIQFDEITYNEFIIVSKDRDATKVASIMNGFKKHLNDICSSTYSVISGNDKAKALNGLYDRLCLYTHSTIIVSTISGISDNKELEALSKLMYQNLYFLKMLLFHCLTYLTEDKVHHLDNNNISLSYLFYTISIAEYCKSNNIDFSKYSEYLYEDENTELINKHKKDITRINSEYSGLLEEINKNPDSFNEMIEDFLS